VARRQRDFEGYKIGIVGLALGLDLLEQRVVFDGVVDRGGGKEGIKAARRWRHRVCRRSSVDDGAFSERFAGHGQVFAVWLEVIDVEAKDIFVFDGVGDGVGVEFALEEVLRGAERGDIPIDLSDGGVFGEDRRAGKAEELGLRKEIFDGLVGLAELGAVALVKDEDHTLVAERCQEIFEGCLAVLLAVLVVCAGLVEGEAKASG